MARSVAVISSIFGGYDEPRPQADQDIETHWYMVTDKIDLDPPKPWTLKLEARHYPDPIMAAKVAKMTPALPHRYIIWLDGAYEITSPSFAREAIAAINASGMAAFAHPRRNCVYREAEASLGAREGQNGRYSHLPIGKQMKAYHAEGHPVTWGLWACGIIAWDRYKCGTLGREWLAECEKWGHQDQLALPPVARRLKLTPGTFPYRQITGKSRKPPYLKCRWGKLWPHSQS